MYKHTLLIYNGFGSRRCLLSRLSRFRTALERPFNNQFHTASHQLPFSGMILGCLLFFLIGFDVFTLPLMQICQEVYFLFFPINFFKRDAKEWEGISGLVSEPCNSKAFGKLLKAFKKISNSLRSDSEIFLNNATSQIPRITMNPQMRPKSLPIPSLCTDKLTYIPFSTACRIACFLHHRRRLI